MSTPAERDAFFKALYEENQTKVTLLLTAPEFAAVAQGLKALIALAKMDRENGRPMDGILQDAAEVAASMRPKLDAAFRSTVPSRA